MRIAVCDDDKIFLRIVEVQVRDYFTRLGTGIELELFIGAEDFWERFDSLPFDIVILDIIMPKQTGIELARRVYQRCRNCVIAFFTSSPDYAVEGYGVNAVGYLLKPATQRQMDELLAKCVERYQENRPASVVFKSGGSTRNIDADRILYLESRNKQVLVHCADETLMFSGKLSDLLERLPPGFVQTHKSYIANLLHVTALSREDMLTDDGRRVPISRQFHKEASRYYHAYLAGQL